jgi:hypothetical protein
MFAGALSTALPAFATVTVKPVPWDPTNLVSPHTVVAGTTAVLTATVDLGGSNDSFTYFWNYGDGSTNQTPQPVTTTGTSATVGNVYNLSVNHVYPVTTGVNYTAVLTVTDTTHPAVYTGSYYLIVQPNSLQATVNQAIDGGLWYLHTTMDRANTTNNNSQTIPWGGWDGQLGNGCVGTGYACLFVGGLDATNVQAFEVSGHYENGPSVDPYTDDVARGLARIMYFLKPVTNTNVGDVQGGTGPKTISYNPALMAARCSDGSQPNYAAKTCATGTYINYNPGATSCTSPPCSFTYDGNNNSQMLIPLNDTYDYSGYETGMYVTAIVASQNAAGVARTGVGSSAGLPGVLGQTYLNIVQDLIDGIGYCQYYGDAENANGYDNGGGWEYYCAGTYSAYYDDNSPSQWNAIAMIAANRAFGITIPPIVTDTNQVWVTWSQDTSSTSKGQFGYYEWDYQPWGPYAVTPSGMVQLAMDGVGRTAANATDQRWNLTESYYRNNFCNALSSGPTQAPQAYTYGLFSFTKAMEEHDPGGVLSPITLLANQPSNTNQIDWYAAQASAGAPCDGVAQTLVSRQGKYGTGSSPLNSPGAWYGADYDGDQFYFETAWSVIMLQKTNFVACVNNLSGAAKAGTRSAGPLVTLTWSGIADAASYTVQRSSTSGGPFLTVGNTTGLAFNDQTAGLVNGNTYYYALQPDNVNGLAVCTTLSTQGPFAIKIP